MERRLKQILAGVLSLLMVITTVFTGNVVTAKAENIVKSDYAEGRYTVGEEGEFESVLIPDGCCFRVEKAIIVTGNITINAGGRLEVVGDGSVSCNTFIVGDQVEEKRPSLYFDKADNVPMVNGEKLELYEPTESGANKLEEVQWSEFVYDYEACKWMRFNPYDEFGPTEDRSIIVEVALVNYEREGDADFPITIGSATGDDVIDGWDRMKARVSGESVTLSWNIENRPTQICVDGAGENGGWLTHDVGESETSFEVTLNRVNYYIEAKYGEVGPGMDVPMLEIDARGQEANYKFDTDTEVTAAPNDPISFEGKGEAKSVTVVFSDERVQGVHVWYNDGTDHDSFVRIEDKTYTFTKVGDTWPAIRIEAIDYDSLYNGEYRIMVNGGSAHRIVISGSEYDGTTKHFTSGTPILFDVEGPVNKVVAHAYVGEPQDTIITMDGGHYTYIPQNDLPFEIKVYQTAEDEAFDNLQADWSHEYEVEYEVRGGDSNNYVTAKIGDSVVSKQATSGNRRKLVLDNSVGVIHLVITADESHTYEVWKNGSNITSQISDNVYEWNVGSDREGVEIIFNSNEPGDEGKTVTLSIAIADGTEVPGHYGIELDETDERGNALADGLHGYLDENRTSDSYNVRAGFAKIRVINAGKDIFYNEVKDNTWAEGKIIAKDELSESYAFQLVEPEGTGEGGEGGEGGGPTTPTGITSGFTKDVTIRFWTKNEQNEFEQIDIATMMFNDMFLNEYRMSAENLHRAGYTVTKGGKATGSNQLMFGELVLGYITSAKLVKNFTEVNGVKTAVELNNDVNIIKSEDIIYCNQAGEEVARYKDPWTVDLPVSEADEDVYDILLEITQRNTVVWSGDSSKFGDDAYVEHGKVQLVGIENSEGTDLIATHIAAASEDSFNATANEGYLTVPVGAIVTVKIIPDYGYQVIGAKLNGVTDLEPKTEVSTFSFEMPERNLHFKGIFTQASDKIDTSSASEVLSATITDASNAAASGNVSLTVEDNASYAKVEEAKTKALEDESNKVASTVATLDMTLDNIVNKNTETDFWTTNIKSFASEITVGLKLDGVTLADGEELVVVREHEDKLDKITATYNAASGTLNVPTNKFSTYSIVKLAKKNVADATIEFNEESFTYNQEEQAPTIMIDGVALDSSKFTVTYTNSSTSDSAKAKIYAGTVTVRIAAKADNDEYTGFTEKTYTIAKAVPTVGDVSYSGDIYTSTPVATVSAGLTRTNTTVPGTLALTGVTAFSSTGTADYGWKFMPTDTTNYEEATGTISLTVSPNTLTGLSVSGTMTKKTYEYGDDIDLSGLTFTAVFANGDTLPVALTDTNLTYTKELSVGQTELTVTYTNNDISQDATVNGFTVTGKNIASATITLGSSLTYNGSDQTQEVSSVVLGGNTLTVASDYTISGNVNKNAGTYTLTITGVGDYAGTATQEYTIAQAILTPSISGTITKIYDGSKAIIDATGLSITVEGKKGDDDVSASARKYEYDTVTVGTGKTISASGILLSGTNATNYMLSSSSTTADCGEITKATPTISLSNLSETTQNPTGVKATLSPVDASANVVIKYEVVITPAKPATPCKYASGHLATCPKKSDEDAECGCGYTDDHVHDAECGYEAAADAEMGWTTRRPTTAGTYNVQATLPSETDNLNAVTEPVTGTYSLTTYVAPSTPSTPPSTPSGDEATDSSKVEETPVVETPAVAPSTTVEETKTEVTEAEDVKQVETKPATTNQATSDEEDSVVIEISSESTWEDVKEEIANQLEAALLDAIENGLEGDSAEAIKVVIEMKEEKVVPADIFETIKGQDVAIVFEMNNGITWTINGKDVTGTDFTDIDFGASTGAGVTAIPSALLEVVSENSEAIELTLDFDGQFGFTATMTVGVEKKNAGLYANLFYFNPDEEQLEFMCAALIDEDGNADLTFTHASDYVIIVDATPLSAQNNVSMVAINDNISNNDSTNGPANDQTILLENQAQSSPLIWVALAVVVVAIIAIGAFLALRKKNNLE